MSAFCPRADISFTTVTPSEAFRGTINGVGVTPVRLPARNPDLNSFAERRVKSVKEECLSKLILFGEKSLRHALREYVVHHHQ